jgi:hypothetical protein
MRRILFTALAAAALCAAAPTAALAHGGRHHHKRHHHARVRHQFFRANGQDASGSSGTPTGTTGAPTAGTVTSFANNILMIKLNDGTTVSGQVTSDTEIQCENPAMQTGDNDADDNGTAGDEQGDAVFNRSDGGGGDPGDQGDQGDDDNNQMCTLTAGMAVSKAELTIDGNGAVWDEVELVSTGTSSPTTPSGTSSDS